MQSAVITGAASGIGRRLAVRLSTKGYAVSLVDFAPLDETARDLSEAGGTFEVLRGDVGTPMTMEDAVAAAVQHGPLEVVALNAGVLAGEPDLTQLSLDRYNAVVNANFHGVVHGMRAVLATTNRASVCRVVITASSVGLVPAPHDPIYVMTKHAVVGFVRSLALQGRSDLRINCICPNGVDTPMLSEALKGGRRLLTPDDVALRICEILAGEGNGEAWVCTPDLFAPFEFAPNPGYVFPASTSTS